MNAQLLIQLIISSIVTIGFFGVTALYVFHPEAFTGPAEKQLTLITGSLITSFTAVVSWGISSTIGSARKTELLAKSEPIIELTEVVSK